MYLHIHTFTHDPPFTMTHFFTILKLLLLLLLLLLLTELNAIKNIQIEQIQNS